MLNSLYKTGVFHINGEQGTLYQLEGRFSFINQLDRKNNNIQYKQNDEKIGIHYLNSREKQYQKFLFLKYLYFNEKPLMITEGKTDEIYLKAALKNMSDNYPMLISRNSDDTFTFHLSFLKRTKRLRYFFNLGKDGANTLNNIYNFYSNKNINSYPNYAKELITNKIYATNPVILLFDNEMISKKPLRDFLSYISLNVNDTDRFKMSEYVNISSNLYLLTNPLIKGKDECELEDLFDDELLDIKIGDKTFNRSDKFDTKRYFGKHIFASHVFKNYKSIDFSAFKPILDNIENIVSDESETQN